MFCNMTTTTSLQKSGGRSCLWFSAWVGFLVFNVIVVAVDWQLRDDSSGHRQPMPGGLPEQWDGFVFLSPIVLMVAVVVSMPERWNPWLKILFAFFQFAAAFVMLFFGRLYYVLSFGIDTL